MSSEHSKGKARTRLPQSRRLKVVRAVPERSDGRRPDGRFGPGNAGGKGRGWKRAITRMLGRDVEDLGDAAATIAADAWRLFGQSLKEMPNDGPNVRALVARKARHEALEGYYTARALAKLGTPEGDVAEQKATLHGTRAERLTVTALDVARSLAEAKPAKAVDLSAALARVRKIQDARERAAREQPSERPEVVEAPAEEPAERDAPAMERNGPEDAPGRLEAAEGGSEAESASPSIVVPRRGKGAPSVPVRQAQRDANLANLRGRIAEVDEEIATLETRKQGGDIGVTLLLQQRRLVADSMRRQLQAAEEASRG